MSASMRNLLRLDTLRKRSVRNSNTFLKSFSSYKQMNLPDNSPLKGLLDESVSYMDKTATDQEDKWATLPYSHLPSEHSEKPQVDPRDTSILLFPGQGSQYIGMGKDLMRYPIAKRIYEIANEILKFDLQKICFEGPQKLLNEHCQLAVLVTSLATVERLKEERPSAIDKCAAVAGFSLGEITALVFSGALDYEEALKLVQIRAMAMEAASKENPGGMLQIYYGADAKLNIAMDEAVKHSMDAGDIKPVCIIGNYMFAGCKVITGSHTAIKYLEENGKKFGIRRTQKINVSGPFHCHLMHAAMQPFRAALNLCDVQKPLVTVISNVNAKPYRNVDHIIRQLPKQIICPVKWEQTLHNLFSRKPGICFPQVFAVGPGDSMRTILRKVNAPAWDGCFAISS